ncbi:hypothetical protein ON010_g3346 [Phytophthora cinnamomi]|nr:hypothetical protein ON010_g3346 [Phytophthora cinnamomi]
MPHEAATAGRVTYYLDRNNQTLDSRPIKALEEPTHHPACWHYRSGIIQHGVTPDWKTAFKSQVTAAPNHGSASRVMNVIIKHLGAGHDASRYLILEIDLLPALEGVTCNPYGAVQKRNLDIVIDARIIHDVSFPPGDSVNDNTIADHATDVSYDGAEALANRILDVAGGISNVATHDDRRCQNRLWKYSYERRSRGTLWWYYTRVGNSDRRSLLPVSRGSTRTADSMVTVLGPDACNEKKFTSWFEKGRALGLDWDLSAQLVSMPSDKVLQALGVT